MCVLPHRQKCGLPVKSSDVVVAVWPYRADCLGLQVVPPAAVSAATHEFIVATVLQQTKLGCTLI